MAGSDGAAMDDDPRLAALEAQAEARDYLVTPTYALGGDFTPSAYAIYGPPRRPTRAERRDQVPEIALRPRLATLETLAAAEAWWTAHTQEGKMGKAARLNAERRITLAAADQSSERLISELEIRAPFKTLFPVKPRVLDAIIADMQAHGYDAGQPIHVWGDTVVDGHTRYQAAVEAGLERVPVHPHAFADEAAALEYAIHNQRDRRNLTDADILRCVAALDQRKPQGQRTDLAQSCAKSGKSAEQTAELLGVSSRKVEQTRTVLDHADEPTRQAVERGEKTLNTAYRETQARRHDVTLLQTPESARAIYGDTLPTLTFGPSGATTPTDSDPAAIPNTEQALAQQAHTIRREFAQFSKAIRGPGIWYALPTNVQDAITTDLDDLQTKAASLAKWVRRQAPDPWSPGGTRYMALRARAKAQGHDVHEMVSKIVSAADLDKPRTASYWINGPPSRELTQEDRDKGVKREDLCPSLARCDTLDAVDAWLTERGM